MASKTAARYWAPHKEHSWLPCSLVESVAETITLQADGAYGAEVVELPAKALAELAQVDAQQEQGVDDVCTLQTVNEAALLHTVRVRYLKDVIYTRVARVIIALNPFRALPIYSSQYTDQYMVAADSTNLPPHIFGLSKDAIQGLKESGRDQAVLISGESGAGKTESAKLVLSFVTDAVRANKEGGSFIEQVCETSPVLEAFGNAMTVRNNNSSRFGKWLDLRFSKSLDLLGCSMTSYLLETTRVCSQSSGERGFHVFFQLLQARESPALAPLGLREPGSYRYLHGAQHVAPGVDDAACYEELCEALAVVGFDEGTRLEIFKAVAGVLTLGNVEFKDADQAQVDDEDTQRRAAELLGVEAARLLKCMTVKKIAAGLEQVSSPLNPDQARAARDALARLFYGQLFLWLIERINSTLRARGAGAPEGAAAGPADAAAERLLGVLDIAGFESFEFNSLEQLLINLSNEHLQQNFNTVVFKQELKDCEQEGVAPPRDLGFMDNSDCLALIDGKAGILDLLDETMAMPKSTNQRYVDNVMKQQASHNRFIKTKVAFMGFGIQHFAGGVTYGCDGWLEKNANRSPNDAVQLLASSANSVLAEIGKSMSEHERETSKPSRGASKKVKSVSAQFRASLRALMTKITEADPHYIRCIKPNMEKVPGRIVGHLAMEQLLLSGVLATVRIRQQGYAVRLPHKTFVNDYMVLWKTSKVKRATALESDAESKAKAEELIENMVSCLPSFKAVGRQAYAVGSTKVFMNLAAARVLDDARERVLHSLVLRFQSVLRGRLARKTTTPWRHIAEGLRGLLARVQLDAPVREAPVAKRGRCSSGAGAGSLRRAKSWTGEGVVAQLGALAAARELIAGLAALLRQAEAASFQNVDVLAARRVQRRLQLEVDAAEQLDRLRGGVDALGLEKAVARAASLRLPRACGLGVLEDRLERLRTQQPLVQAMAAALAELPEGNLSDTAAEQFEDLAKAARAAGLEGAAAAWLPELGGAERLREVLGRLAARRAERPEEEAAAGGCGPAASPAAEAPAAASAEAQTPVSRRRSSRARTISFQLGPEEDETQIRKGLRRAAAECDARALEALLRRAEALGLRDEDAEGSEASDGEAEGCIAGARRVLEQLQSPDFVVASIQAASGEVAQCPSMELLRRLEHLSRQLRRLPGYEEEAAEAGRCVRRGLLRRSAQSHRRSVFDARDAGELELAAGAFGGLADFPELKQVWTGKQEPNDGSATGRSDGKVAHSKACLDEAMTRAPPNSDIEAFEAAAVQNFRNVLVCMGDRPAQECQRQASREAILELAGADEGGLRNEVYLQVMKQLVACPRERTARLGWALLQKLCIQAPPTSEAAEFVRQLITGFLDSRPNDRDTAATARSCLHILDGLEDDVSQGLALDEENSNWTPGISRLKAENMRLRAQGKKQAAEIERQAAEIERLIAEILRLGGRPAPGPRTAPTLPQSSVAAGPAAEESEELVNLRRQAVQRGMLHRQASSKTPEELMRWLKQQACQTTPAPMALATRGGPSPVRFMDLPDSDSDDLEIDLSQFADAGN